MVVAALILGLMQERAKRYNEWKVKKKRSDDADPTDFLAFPPSFALDFKSFSVITLGTAYIDISTISI